MCFGNDSANSKTLSDEEMVFANMERKDSNVTYETMEQIALKAGFEKIRKVESQIK
jgi:hypothetical protein